MNYPSLKGRNNPLFVKVKYPAAVLLIAIKKYNP